jgi:hypothetical protein
MITIKNTLQKGVAAMIPESFQIPALVAAVIALASFIIIPVIAMNDRMEVQDSSNAMSDEIDGTSCALPPSLDIEENGGGLIPGPLLVDDNEGRILKMATFALG